MARSEVPEAVLGDLRAKGVDVELTLSILDSFNSGKYDSVVMTRADSIPSIDGERVVDLVRSDRFKLDGETARARLASLGIALPAGLPPGSIEHEGKSLFLSRAALAATGKALYPVTAYGILNGGSATSFADGRKNEDFDPALFRSVRAEFESCAPGYVGRPKGVTPAYVNRDGSPGASFLQLKFRSLLIRVLEYRLTTGDVPVAALPVFQMTSRFTDAETAEALEGYARDPILADLIGRTGCRVTETAVGVQPLIAAYTHSERGRPKGIFASAFGKENSVLPLPGGHGQNFRILRRIYEELRERGKRFAYLTNVDNLGSTVDPVALALLALSGKPAAFDFSYRTPVDVKGGILVVDQYGRMNCADIGAAISLEEVLAKSAVAPPLFNCATGIFDLEYLTGRIDDIIENLPMRFSDQAKDAGRYSQAEQVTWELIGMLDDFLILAVDKYDRFLANKLLVENFLMSGIGEAALRVDSEDTGTARLREVAGKLRAGLAAKLSGDYGMKLVGGRWVPLPVDALIARLSGHGA